MLAPSRLQRFGFDASAKVSSKATQEGSRIASSVGQVSPPSHRHSARASGHDAQSPGFGQYVWPAGQTVPPHSARSTPAHAAISQYRAFRITEI